jgi:hypothetical protein
MADGSMARLFWRALDTLDYRVMQARSRSASGLQSAIASCRGGWVHGSVAGFFRTSG